MNEKIDIIRRLARKQTSALERALQKTRAPDIAEAIVYSAPYEQRFIWQAISSDELASEVLASIPENALEDFLHFVPIEQLTRLVNLIEVDDQADILDALPEELQSQILANSTRRRPNTTRRHHVLSSR